MSEKEKQLYAELAPKLVNPERPKRKPHWKSESVPNYQKIHRWVYSNFGKANKCEQCQQEEKSYSWANISGEYKLQRDDWEELCASCHKKKDVSYETLRQGALNNLMLGENRRGVMQVSEGTGQCVAMFRSTKEAAAFIGVVPSAITRCLTGKIRRVKGHRWQYGA